ncbi:sialate O-acetylesterase [Planctomycetota bacterium]
MHDLSNGTKRHLTDRDWGIPGVFPKRIQINGLIFGLLITVLPQLAYADIRLHGLFLDHMVVQRDTEIPVWGWADPGENVSVKAGWGAQAQVLTGADGSWSTRLKTPPAGGPFQVTFSGKNTIILNDVLSGDVWLCTGQSNMDFAMSKFVDDAREPRFQPLVEYIRHEVATVNDPWIRHIEVPRAHSLSEKKTNFEGTWVSANSEQVGVMTATGYFFAKTLRKHLEVPIGLLECSYGGTRIQPWLSEETYMADEQMKAYFEANRKEARAIIAEVNAADYKDTSYQEKYQQWVANEKRDPRPWPRQHPTVDKQMPATLYNGMISAIVPYAIKGALWYQGESNSHYKEELYGAYLTRLITSWRAQWDQGDFPFYWVQLAAYKQTDKRSDLGWALVNDQMRHALTLPNTGMAVLHDIGEPADVHPHNKIDAGKRLALWALQQDYGVNVPAVSGPLYKSSKVVNGKMLIKFDHVGSGLMVGHKVYLNNPMPVDMPLTWFEICGADHQWKKAIAKIVSKDAIEVSHPDIAAPTAVRYAWSSNPEGANLYNKEGLPAAVFSTED